MGVHCEVNLFKPSDGEYIPGETVSGMIKYAVDEETTFNKITMSLKGHGEVLLKDKRRRRKRKLHRYRQREEYIDIDQIIRDDKNGFTIPRGAYEHSFSFKLPDKLPPSFQYFNTTGRYVVRCNINYYVRIKFDRPGFLKFAKRYKKELQVVTGITPRLPTVPTYYGTESKLINLLSFKPRLVIIKANVLSSVVSPGGKIELEYEVINQTNLILKGVETKLVEVNTFNARSRQAKYTEDIKDTDTKTGSITEGQTQTMDIKIDVPSHLSNIENSNIAARDYLITITAVTPMPHFNVVLEIPVQIGNTSVERATVVPPDADDPPPSYWEVMGEDMKDEKKESDDDSEDDDDEKVPEKGEKS